MYKFLANLVTVFHIAFMAVFLVAIVISLQGRLNEHSVLQAFLWIWVSAKTIFYLIFRSCVLTKFEQYLRRLSGRDIFTDGFIKHYLGKIGISVSDTTVVWIVVAPAVVGIVSEVYQKIN